MLFLWPKILIFQGSQALMHLRSLRYKRFLRGCLRLKNGNVQEFVDNIHYGDELIFLYHGCKFFLQGYLEDDNRCTLYLDRWEPPGTDYIWVGKGDAKHFPVEEFLQAKLWDGRNFWEAQEEMEWVDA